MEPKQKPTNYEGSRLNLIPNSKIHTLSLSSNDSSSSHWMKILTSSPVSNPLYNKISKRIIDIIGALTILILASPIMILIASLLIFNQGSIIFSHRRVGHQGRSFPCLKFRTMQRNAEKALQNILDSNQAAREEWQANFKLRNDPRITPLGRFLRKTSLDELPQLFNVLSGDMSLVGPRPITHEEIIFYQRNFAYYVYCRPGLTGIWQISGRSDLDYNQRVECDKQYINTWSNLNDIKIILKTPQVLFKPTGAY